ERLDAGYGPSDKALPRIHASHDEADVVVLPGELALPAHAEVGSGKADDRQAHLTGIDELERMGRTDCRRRDCFHPEDILIENLHENLTNRKVTTTPKTNTNKELHNTHP